MAIHGPYARSENVAAGDALAATTAGNVEPLATERIFDDRFDGDACMAPAGLTRMLFGTVIHANAIPRSENLTGFEYVFGWQPTGPRKVWPGVKYLLQRTMMPANNYVAYKFTVPMTMNTNNYGLYRFDETQPQALMSVTISPKCGDFRPATLNPIAESCAIENMFAGGANPTALYWKLPGSPFPSSVACPLQPGQTYYLNMINAPLSDPTSSNCAFNCGNLISNDGNGVWP